MKGDFTRVTFDPTRHFSRVLMQQGRVTLDADPNEQTDILLHYLRTLAADLIGPYAGPAAGGGFALTTDAAGQLAISAGRYYVDGILVENEEPCLYADQPAYPLAPDDPLAAETQNRTGNTFWVYLDVWERHVTYLDEGSIRESALGGPDTCSRSQVVWQVKAKTIATQPDKDGVPANADRAKLEKLASEIKARLEKANSDQRPALERELAAIEARLAQLPKDETPTPAPAALSCGAPLADLVAISSAALAARLDPGAQQTGPCVLAPDAKYRGAENQLYRVEIHVPGKAGAATFKWSRDNGSVTTAWVGTNGNDLVVTSARGFSAGCWVELLDEVTELHGLPGVLVKVAKVEGQAISIDPASVPAGDSLAWSAGLVNPKLRRWDQASQGDSVLQAGAVPVVESTATQVEWLDLEDGIQVQFAAGGEYRTGDYWLIPARVATGEIEWPEDGSGGAVAIPPQGIEHHYAPLGYVSFDGKQWSIQSCTCTFNPLSSCFAAASPAPSRPKPTLPNTGDGPVKANPAVNPAGIVKKVIAVRGRRKDG